MYEKLSQRGLSSLISISDGALSTGLIRLREWTGSQPEDQPVFEPIDMFIFRRKP